MSYSTLQKADYHFQYGQTTNELLDDELTSNVCVVINDQKILCHDNVLSQSKYFKAVFDFEGSVEKDAQNRIKISLPEEFIKADTLRSVIEFMYSGSILITTQNAPDLLATGDYLQVFYPGFAYKFVKFKFT